MRLAFGAGCWTCWIRAIGIFKAFSHDGTDLFFSRAPWRVHTETLTTNFSNCGCSWAWLASAPSGFRWRNMRLKLARWCCMTCSSC
jgi:hypothetical protein